MKSFNENLIDGRRSRSTGKIVELASPHTGAIDRSVQLSGADEVGAAVAAAKAALSDWSATPVEQRAKHLATLADAIEARTDEFVECIVAEVGTPPRIAAAVQVGLAITDARVFAELGAEACADDTIGHSTVRHRPLGVVAAVSPWNYPLHQAVAKIGAAAVAGCTVVLKPSELVPATNELLMDAVAASFPPGVVNVIHGGGETGATLIAHPDVDAISFTGSTATGKSIARAASETLTPCFLELGGKSPAVILPGADLSTALKGALNSGWLNSGQTCTALTRVLVHEDSLDAARELVPGLAEKMQSRLGPLISEAQFDRVQGFIQRGVDSGAEVLAGGVGRPAGAEEGFMTQATVFVVDDPSHELVQEEIFGPVICLQPYSDTADAIRLANNTVYGLAAAVWGGSDDPIDEVTGQIKAGQIDVNGAPFNPQAPFGGFGSSGSGRELGLHGIREFTRPVSVQQV